MTKQAKPKRGRPPQEGRTMTRTTMVRMHDEDDIAFREEADRLTHIFGVKVTVGSYLRMAGRAMLGKKIHP
jgi:hypothetical protein